MTAIDEDADRALADVDWHAFPTGTRHDRFHAPSGELTRVRLGSPDAPRVVLVPGFAGSKEDFVRVFPLLADAGLHVESFDLAGHYASADAGPHLLRPPRDRYDYPLYVDDLVAVLRDGALPAHVVGYSFGGLIAQLAAAAHPELFASLALVATPPAAGQVFRGVSHIGPHSDMDPHRAAGVILWGIRYNLNREPSRRIAFVRERLRATSRGCLDDVVGAMMATPDVSAAVAALPAPKLVIAGDRDLWPATQHRAYARRIGAQLVLYPGGHAPCERFPHRVCGDLVRNIGITGRGE